MNLIKRTLSALGFEKRAVNGDPYWSNFDALRTGAVTPQAAETLSTVSACVSAISETIGSLPLHLYKRTPEGRERNTDHSLARVLHDAPNERQSALEFREMMTAAMLLRGNAYARIIRGNDGQVKQLIPLHPDRVRVLELDNGRLGYEVGTNEKTEKLIQEDVFHLRHRSDDGILGISPIARSKEVIELALAERNHGIETFQNGAKYLGFIKLPGKLNPEQRRGFAESWKQYKSGSTPILENGMDYQTASMSLEDSEWISARQLSVEEVCRLFRIPPTIVGDLRHGNYANTSELFRQFVTLSLRRHLLAWEQAISRQLLTEAGRRIYFAEHSLEGLLRGDPKTRADFYHAAIGDGWMTIDEVRQLENLPKLVTA
jgi:HK97 family phage portal protein